MRRAYADVPAGRIHSVAETEGGTAPLPDRTPEEFTDVVPDVLDAE